MGHEERFPRTRLSARCRFRKETIAGMRRNGRDAPIRTLLPSLPDNSTHAIHSILCRRGHENVRYWFAAHGDLVAEWRDRRGKVRAVGHNQAGHVIVYRAANSQG
jgi:hypothetical protein